jgi:hypothetical protein
MNKSLKKIYIEQISNTTNMWNVKNLNLPDHLKGDIYRYKYGKVDYDQSFFMSDQGHFVKNNSLNK